MVIAHQIMCLSQFYFYKLKCSILQLFWHFTFHLDLGSFFLLLEIDSDCATTCLAFLHRMPFCLQRLCVHVHNCCAVLFRWGKMNANETWKQHRQSWAEGCGFSAFLQLFFSSYSSSLQPSFTSILFPFLALSHDFHPNVPHFLLQSHPNLSTGEQIKNIW